MYENVNTEQEYGHYFQIFQVDFSRSRKANSEAKLLVQLMYTGISHNGIFAIDTKVFHRN